MSLVSALIGCKEHKQNGADEYWKWHSRQVIESIINHKVTLPDSITVFRPDSLSFSKLMTKDFKIIYCINLDCGVCLSKFKYWNSIKSELEEKYKTDIPILAVVTADSCNSNIEAYINSTWGHEWIYDPDEDFAFLNNLEDDRFHAILADRNDTIRLVGNPFNNPALKDLYEKAILRYIQ